MYLVLQVVLGQDHARRAERVGLHHVAAHAVEGSVNVLDDVGPAQHQQFVAAFLAPVVVHSGVAGLDAGPHGAVEDDDAFLHGF